MIMNFISQRHPWIEEDTSWTRWFRAEATISHPFHCHSILNNNNNKNNNTTREQAANLIIIIIIIIFTFKLTSRR